jgi:hypothetical protein
MQVSPPAADIMELFIYLAEPCHASQLLLTISHGADDSSSPTSVDVRTGCNLDGLQLVVEVCDSFYGLDLLFRATILSMYNFFSNFAAPLW